MLFRSSGRLPEPARANVREFLLQRWTSPLPWFVPLLPWLQGDYFRSSTRLWSALGVALMGPALMVLARRWMRDWRGRDDLEPWMLYNVISAFGQTDREEARAALDRALRLPADTVRPNLMSWSLWLEARTGSAEGYQAALKDSGNPGRSSFDWMLRCFAQAVALGRGSRHPKPRRSRASPRSVFSSPRPRVPRTPPNWGAASSATPRSSAKRCGRSGRPRGSAAFSGCS